MFSDSFIDAQKLSRSTGDMHAGSSSRVCGLLVGFSICLQAPKRNQFDSVSSGWAGSTFLVISGSARPSVC